MKQVPEIILNCLKSFFQTLCVRFNIRWQEGSTLFTYRCAEETAHQGLHVKDKIQTLMSSTSAEH